MDFLKASSILLILPVIKEKNLFASKVDSKDVVFDFLGLQVNRSCLSEVEAIVMDLEAANRALLHPMVVIWVSSATSHCDFFPPLW